MARVSFIPASSGLFRFEGRFDFSAVEGPAVIWPGSRIDLGFSGPMLRVRFGPAVDQNVFVVAVDGRSELYAVPAGEGGVWLWPHVLGPAQHELTLFKRTEATAGHAVFAGVEITDAATAWRPNATEGKLRMEFFGDSITVGACNEDGATDQWDDRRTHNHALSYAALTAAAFHADHRCLAVSGMGIAAGYVDVKAGEVWDRIYPRADSPRADLTSWQPHVAFVNFGENDDSYSRSIDQPFPSGYAAGYVSLVKAIRAAYLHAHLVLLRGGMYGGSQSSDLRSAWTAAVSELAAGDPAISHFIFQHWSANHPRVADHRVMAAELTAWLKPQSFMQRIF